MSVYRYQLADHSAELTLIDAESKSVEDAQAVLEWQFGADRVRNVRHVLEAPNAGLAPAKGFTPTAETEPFV